MVVVAGHRPAVGTGAGHREQVAGTHVAGQELVLDDDVAGLAVLADDAGQRRPGRRRPGRPASRSSRRRRARCGCCRSSRRRPRRRSGTAPPSSATVLDGADLVDGAQSTGRRSPGRARSTGAAPRARARAHSCSTISEHARGERLGVRRVVLRGVGDAEAAAEVQLGQLDAELGRDPRVQREHPAGRDLEAGGVEDLRADVASAGRAARSPGAASTRRTASSASPPAIEKPNFWSSWAVAMYSWVCASTPAVTRISTRRGPAELASSAAASRSISSKESTMIRPTPSSTAARAARPTDLLLPWKPIRSGGKPARSATASSPPVQTSRAGPPRRTQRPTVVQRNALPA